MPENETVETVKGRPDPQPYDFRRPTKLAREHSRLLEMVYETVARQWATVLGSEMGTPCQVTFTGVEQRSYDDYVSTLPSPNLLALFHPEPHPGTGFLQLSPSIGFQVIELVLGGRGGEQPNRVPTEIESQLVLRVVERMLAELRYGLAAVTTVAPVLRALEHNPQFVQVAAATDLYIVASFGVAIAGLTAVATIALPAPVLAMRAPDESGATDPATRLARAEARSAMSRHVEDVPVEVSVRFHPRAVPSSQLLGLRTGDVIRLDHPVDRPLDVVSAGVVCARGVAGTQGAKAACLITSSTTGSAGTPSTTSAQPGRAR
jgi:flagellar motor switch protein FliM